MLYSGYYLQSFQNHQLHIQRLNLFAVLLADFVNQEWASKQELYEQKMSNSPDFKNNFIHLEILIDKDSLVLFNQNCCRRGEHVLA